MCLLNLPLARFSPFSLLRLTLTKIGVFALMTGLILLGSGAGPATAQATAGTVITVTDPSQMAATLARGVSGAVLELGPGTYNRFVLREGEAPAILRSTDPEDPAVLAGLRISDFEDLLVEDLVFSYTYEPQHAISWRPFEFQRGNGLTLRNMEIVGDVARDRDATSDGLGFAIGLSLRSVSNAIVTNTHISLFYRGLVVGGGRDIHITDNELVDLRMDGMNFSSVREVWIENNLIHGFDRSTDPRDHSDMIQFWTNGTETPSRDIFIRGNTLNSGDGNMTQTIFMRNDMVDRGLAGEEMFYRNITIEDNLILNGHLHGITVGETLGLSIRNNTVVQNPAAIGDDPSQTVRIPRINLSSASRRVRVEGNITSDIVGVPPGSSWQVDGNLFVQNQSLLQPNHYSRVFANYLQGDLTQADTYRLRPDLSSELGLPPLGASGLRP